jgi:FkbM family methyltransferase
VLVGLARNKPVNCYIKSGDCLIPAIVTRSNIRTTIPRLLALQRKGLFQAIELSDKYVRANVNGSERHFEIDAFTSLMTTMNRLYIGSGIIELVSVERHELCVTYTKLNIQLRGSIADVLGVIYEMENDDRYYWDANVEGKVVIDVGAFIGDSPLFFVARGARAVYAFEPSRPHYEIAMANVNHLGNVFLMDYGLGLADEDAILIGEGMEKRIGKGEGEKVRIRGFSTIVSEIIQKEGRIGLLKIDCEGCEWQIARRMDKNLFDKIDAVYIEIHGPKQLELVKNFEDMGFELTKQPSKMNPLGGMYYFEKAKARPKRVSPPH